MAGRRLENCVALVTGGSRGVGKGVAIGLAEAGASVIVTARTRSSGASEWPGSLDETIAAIDQAGGKGFGLLCDHSDEQPSRRFSRGSRANSAASMCS
jgi:dehydrogenase/reductase SDR family protein 1